MISWGWAERVRRASQTEFGPGIMPAGVDPGQALDRARQRSSGVGLGRDRDMGTQADQAGLCPLPRLGGEREDHRLGSWGCEPAPARAAGPCATGCRAAAVRTAARCSADGCNRPLRRRPPSDRSVGRRMPVVAACHSAVGCHHDATGRYGASSRAAGRPVASSRAAGCTANGCRGGWAMGCGARTQAAQMEPVSQAGAE